MRELKVKWSDPIKLFKPGKYNTDEKFIEHLRKFISENDNPLLNETGIFMFLAGNIKPEEKLSVVFIEGTDEESIKDRIVKKKGHVREFKCIYKNYKDENLYLKIGKPEADVDIDKIVCAYTNYAYPSCNEKCQMEEKIIIKNEGNYSPLAQIYGQEEE